MCSRFAQAKSSTHKHTKVKCLGLLDLADVANIVMPDRPSTMPSPPSSLTVHDTIPEIAIVPPLESDDEMWARIEQEAKELDAHVFRDSNSENANETIPSPDSNGGSCDDDAPAYVRLVRRHLAARNVGLTMWWHTPANIASLLSWLNDQPGGIDVKTCIEIVEKPWHWGDEYDDMLRQLRERDEANGKRPTLFDEVQSEEYAERRGCP